MARYEIVVEGHKLRKHGARRVEIIAHPARQSPNLTTESIMHPVTHIGNLHVIDAPQSNAMLVEQGFAAEHADTQHRIHTWLLAQGNSSQ